MNSYVFLIPIVIIYGALLGNYLTTAYHRVPLNKPINGVLGERGIKPHCSACNHALRYYEYFPILSWIFTRQRCNYCGIAVDKVYTMLEVGMIIISLLLFLRFGMNTKYVLLTLFSATVLLFVTLYITHRKFYFKPLAFVIASGIIFILGDVDEFTGWVCVFVGC